MKKRRHSRRSEVTPKKNNTFLIFFIVAVDVLYARTVGLGLSHLQFKSITLFLKKRACVKSNLRDSPTPQSTWINLRTPCAAHWEIPRQDN